MITLTFPRNDRGSTVINEVKLGWGQSTISKSISVHSVLPNTNLAAAYDPKQKKQLIIFQNKKLLRSIDSTGNSGNSTYSNSKANKY
jgi:hypothetical protein